jgi:selenocysteine-specific elongation factor
MLRPERAEALLEALVSRGLAEVQGDRVRSAGHEVKLTAKQRTAADAVRSAMGGGGFPMFSGKELEERAGPAVRDILPLMTAAGEVVRFGGDFFMSSETRERIRAQLASWCKERGPLISVPEFKEALGSTRKYVMPLLEHLDDLRWTRREGDGRRILVQGP